MQKKEREKMSDKKDVYYFSHDANALSDPKILGMRCDYGLERIRIVLGNTRNVTK